MRKILREDDEFQTQGDEDGREYLYRKDFIAKGDFKTEYSLSLCYTRHPRIERPAVEPSSMGKPVDGTEIRQGSEPPLPVQS
jgi:hypothetical protein